MKKTIKVLCMSLAISMGLTFAVPTSAFALGEENDKEDYSKETLIETDIDKVLEKSIKNNIESTGNKYPIVLMHGLFGWGNKELLNMNYWGGDDSLRDMLNNEGYKVFTPTLGPIASNWDRACELYAYLKGGTVDYGEAHSQREGHNRYGRTYEGVLPDLGSYDENGELKKVHLVGHSMGGETVRVLAQLLEQGDDREVEATGENTSPLFTGDKHWIDSVTTLCTPHDGSQEDERVNGFEPVMHKLYASYAAYAGANESNAKLDLKMDQWGLKQEPNESYQSYAKRVFKSNIWKDTKDLSIWDLSLEGARELNSWVKTQDDIYYFSVSCVDSHKSLSSGYQVPNINMDPLLWKSSKYIGSFTRNEPGLVPVDESWWRNDGVVSVRSAIAPHEGSTDKVVDYDGTPERGEWNYLGEIKNIDHIEIVGQHEPIYKNYLKNKFRSWAKMLRNL